MTTIDLTTTPPAIPTYRADMPFGSRDPSTACPNRSPQASRSPRSRKLVHV